MKINRWLHLSSGPWKIPLYCDLFRKRIDQKQFPFIATNNWIVLAVQWSVKFFLLRIPRYSGNIVEKRRGRDNYEALCFSSKRKNVIMQGFSCTHDSDIQIKETNYFKGMNLHWLWPYFGKLDFYEIQLLWPLYRIPMPLLLALWNQLFLKASWKLNLVEITNILTMIYFKQT